MKENKELERLEKKWVTQKASKREIIKALDLRRKLKKKEKNETKNDRKY